MSPKYGMSFVGYLCSLFYICAIDIHYDVDDEITHPFPDFNGAAVEVGNADG